MAILAEVRTSRTCRSPRRRQSRWCSSSTRAIAPSARHKASSPYYLEAEATGQKPYVLLRNALKESGKVAVVKVALRSREALAVVRVSGDVMVMQTMLWPDEVRDASFAAPSADVSVSKAETPAWQNVHRPQMSGDVRSRRLQERVPGRRLETSSPRSWTGGDP